MSAVIAPRCTSKWSTSTAVSPPKRRTTPSTTRIGSGFATPGRGSIVAAIGSPADTDCHLPPVAEYSLGPEDHECHEPGANEDLDGDPDLVALEEVDVVG